mgnify:CR=1 FL=1
MPVRLRDISTWVTFMALLLTLLMGSGVLVYCVGPGDHAAIELAHGKQPCGDPADGQEDAPEAEGVTNLVSASECVDQSMTEEALLSIVSPSSELVIAAPASLLYELAPLEELQSSRIFSRWQDTPVHPDLSVVQFVVLLI